ncbi:MAG: protein kinase [Deltaproteobacteria bacterium]|nr:protein kinase [Deltaproteobacteria bacterium]
MKTIERKVFGPYQTAAHLDTGGMAEVFLAQNRTDGSLAVIKLLLEHLNGHEELLEMFRHEGQIMTLLDHPNVVKVLGIGDHQSGLPYIVMEYLAGDHLGVLIRAANKHKQKMPYTLVTRIAIQVANGLAYVHDAKDHNDSPLSLVHRDVSPQNIFLCYDGRVKLLDFGIAVTAKRTEVTRVGMLKGKISYMSPQQTQQEPLDGRSDIFSLGIVTWQLLTGKKLFKAESPYKTLKKICNEKIPSPREIRQEIPKALDAIVMRCLERDPNNRFTSAADLREALTRFLFFGKVQGRANELPLFAEHVLRRRKNEKKEIITSLNREHALREHLFGDLDQELPGFEFGKSEKPKHKAYTPVTELTAAEQQRLLDSEVVEVEQNSSCEWCGTEIDVKPGEDQRCQRCRESAKEVTLIDTGPEWMVRKPDFRTFGPLTTKQVLDKFEEGEIGAADMLAHADDPKRFRLISVYPEFAPFFRLPSSSFDSEKERRRFAIGPLKGWTLLAAGLAFLVTTILVVCLLWPEPTLETTILDETIAGFASEIPKPSGTSADLLAHGQKLSLADQKSEYLKADKILKSAVLLDQGNFEILAAWIQNKALLDLDCQDILERKTALDLIEYALRKKPKLAVLHRAKAYLFFSLGNRVQAREAAKQALTLNKDDHESLIIMGASYLFENDVLAAEKLENALLANPKLMLAYSLLADADLRLGRFRHALEILMKRLEKVPGEFDTMMSLAKLYFEIGHLETATETYRRICGIEPLKAEPVVALAQIETQIRRRPRRAAKILEKFLSQDKLAQPDIAKANTELSVALRLQGKYKKADSALNKAAQLDDSSLSTLYAQAALSLESGKNRQALELLLELRPRLPQSSRVLVRLADAHTVIPNYDQALHDFKLAVELQPEDLDVLLMIAAFYLYIDKPAKAFEWLQRTCNIDTLLKHNHMSLSGTYDGPGLLAKTASRTREAAAKYDDKPLAHVLEGIVLLRLGLPTKAKARLRAALALDANCVPAYQYLGIIEMGQKKPRKALVYLQTAHRIAPQNSIVTKLLATALFKIRKHKKAKVLFSKILKAKPHDSTALLGLSEVLLAKKKTKRATSLLSKAFNQDQKNTRVKSLLYRLGF